jgi:branched-chain amino acid transport system ATP-binding protein
MVAVGRALMAKPKVLLMDEPSMGLAPVLVQQNFDIIEQINEAGVTVFMVEQNANMALSIADRGYVLQTGRIVLDDTAEALMANEDLRKAYLGDIE